MAALFLWGFLATISIHAPNSTHENILIVVSDDTKEILTTNEYKNWQNALTSENFFIKVEIVNRNSAPKFIKNLIKKNRANYVLILGNLRLPYQPIGQLVIDKTKNQYKVLKNRIFFIPSIIDWTISFRAKVGFLRARDPETLRSYFSRNLEYRTCVESDRALSAALFSDQDWTESNNIKAGINILSQQSFSFSRWEDLISFNNENSITDFLQIAVHSNAIFHYPAEYERKLFSTDDIREWNPKFRFINLIACYSGNPQINTNIADTYLLENDTTLAVIAPSNSGGLFETSRFYSSLKNNETIGAALLNYMKALLPKWYEDGEEYKSIVSGLILYGDPTLKIRRCEQ